MLVRDAPAARLQHVHGRQVAPVAERARDGRPGPYDRWPLGRGFERFYGFLGGDTSQWYPELVYDNHPVEPPRTPEDGYHLSERPGRQGDRVHPGRRRSTRTSRSTCTYCIGADARAAPRGEGVGRQVRGQVRRRLGRVPREGLRQRQKELGIVPADTELSRTTPTSPSGTSLSRGRAQALRRMMEVFAGFLSHTDHHFGRLLDFLRGDRRARQHHGHGHLRQRRQRRGRPDRHDQRDAVLQQRPGVDRGEPRVIDEIGGPNVLQPLPVGLDVGRQHAVPALEAGDLPGRHRPTRSSSRGPSGITARGEIRTQYAHIIDMVPTVLDAARASSRRPRSAASPSRRSQGVSFAHTLRRRRRRDPTTTRSTSRCSVTGRSTTTDGAPSARGPARRFAEAAGRAAFGSPISADELADLDANGWELYHVARGLRREPQRRRRPPRQAHRDDRYVVRRGRQVRRDADRRQSMLERMIVEKPPSPRRATATSTIPAGQSVPFFAAPRCTNRPHSITADVEIPEGGAEGVLLCQGTPPAATRSSSRTASCTTSTTTSRRACSASRRPARSRPGSTSSASSSSRPGSPTCRTARARPGGCSSTSTAPWSATRRARHHPVRRSTRGRSPAAPTPARRSPPTTPARSSSPAPSTR